MKLTNFSKLLVAIIVSEFAGVVGAFFIAPAIQSGWYASLAKPALNPPSWIFGPVWTALYILMGVSAFLIWSFGSAQDKSFGSASGERGRTTQDKKKGALIIFIVQLFLNALWSIIFFGLRSPGGALVEIILLWLAIVWTIAVFSKISKPAAWLLAPYILWVSFAVYLNLSIRLLN